MADPLPIVDAFHQVALLSRLSERQREKIASRVTTRSYREGSTIVRQGDTSVSFYVVLAGRARIEHEAGGRRIVVGRLGPGGAFGGAGRTDDLPPAATGLA